MSSPRPPARPCRCSSSRRECRRTWCRLRRTGSIEHQRVAVVQHHGNRDVDRRLADAERRQRRRGGTLQLQVPRFRERLREALREPASRLRGAQLAPGFTDCCRRRFGVGEERGVAFQEEELLRSEPRAGTEDAGVRGARRLLRLGVVLLGHLRAGREVGDRERHRSQARVAGGALCGGCGRRGECEQRETEQERSDAARCRGRVWHETPCVV